MTKHTTLTSLLESWDKLSVLGVTPDRCDSILTSADGLGIKIAIEYKHQISSYTGYKPSTVAYLVAWDENGNRVSLRNQQWGCFDDEEKQFHEWFARKMAEAERRDNARRERLQEACDEWLA